MDEIARAAGFSRQELYFYYATKDELFRATVLHSFTKRLDAGTTAKADVHWHSRRELLGGVSKKLEVIRAAAQHDYPLSEIEGMLAEIERRYGTGTHP
jgi:AcrR family transcriptional regulator